MPRFLLKASYTPDGVKGLLKEGGTGRRTAVTKMVEGLDGKVLFFEYALGEDDVYVLADMPDTIAAVATSLAVNASGAVTIQTTELLSPEDMDAAAKKAVDYRAPGG